MMTVHAAKGSEFDVFVVGLEEDLFPSAMSKDNPRAVEEERRLFYVAITRAEENCVLTHARSRYRNGQSTMCSPSRFLKDIDPKYIYTSQMPLLPTVYWLLVVPRFPATEGNGRRGLCLSGRSGSRTAGSSDTDGNGFFVFGPVFVFCAGSVGFACRG